jgi:hypothetical protein
VHLHFASTDNIRVSTIKIRPDPFILLFSFHYIMAATSQQPRSCYKSCQEVNWKPNGCKLAFGLINSLYNYLCYFILLLLLLLLLLYIQTSRKIKSISSIDMNNRRYLATFKSLMWVRLSILNNNINYILYFHLKI